jgi:hypothetical protein
MVGAAGRDGGVAGRAVEHVDARCLVDVDQDRTGRMVDVDASLGLRTRDGWRLLVALGPPGCVAGRVADHRHASVASSDADGALETAGRAA